MKRKLFAWLLAITLALALAACGEKPTDEGGGGDKPTATPKASTKEEKKDEWPASIFEPYGVPAFEGGKVTYHFKYEQGTGNVMLTATREELVAYLETLKGLGFAIRDYEEEDIRNDSWGSFEFYLPKRGTGYSLDGYFTFENEEGAQEEYYDEDSGEAFYVKYNVSLSMVYHGVNETKIQADMLTAVGLQNKDYVPADCRTAEARVISDEPYSAIVAFGYDFDDELTEAEYRAFVDRLIDACCNASDEKQLSEVFGDGVYDAAAAKEAKLNGWLFDRDGKTYYVMLIAEAGYGEGIGFSLSEVSG